MRVKWRHSDPTVKVWISNRWMHCFSNTALVHLGYGLRFFPTISAVRWAWGKWSINCILIGGRNE